MIPREEINVVLRQHTQGQMGPLMRLLNPDTTEPPQMPMDSLRLLRSLQSPLLDILLQGSRRFQPGSLGRLRSSLLLVQNSHLSPKRLRNLQSGTVPKHTSIDSVRTLHHGNSLLNPLKNLPRSRQTSNGRRKPEKLRGYKRRNGRKPVLPDLEPHSMKTPSQRKTFSILSVRTGEPLMKRRAGLIGAVPTHTYLMESKRM